MGGRGRKQTTDYAGKGFRSNGMDNHLKKNITSRQRAYKKWGGKSLINNESCVQRSRFLGLRKELPKFKWSQSI